MIKKILIIAAILAAWAGAGLLIENHDQANHKAFAEAHGCTWKWSGSHYLCK